MRKIVGALSMSLRYSVDVNPRKNSNPKALLGWQVDKDLTHGFLY
jgi:hypothetical protein